MSSGIVAAIEQLPGADDLPLPAYATDGAAGVDLLAAVGAEAGIELAPGCRALVPTGIRIALPRGYEGQVRPRSGLALRHGVTVLNAPGTIDSDYRGEIGVVLANFGEEPFPVVRGMRIAQLVIAPVVRVSWRKQEVAAGATGRGAQGFGSTGLAGGLPANSHRRD